MPFKNKKTDSTRNRNHLDILVVLASDGIDKGISTTGAVLE